ncbi:hypothetical protein F4859DRAFT_223044 [Xylaria cf. heliscus]|nr:hypothetical protein F4859DRAFT_223044 [Xylaria cf. heliscus]
MASPPASPSYQNLPMTGTHYIFSSWDKGICAPVFCVMVPHQPWINRGLELLATAGDSPEGESVHLPENTLSHLCEGDLVHAAAECLVHPIRQALSTLPAFASSIRRSFGTKDNRSNSNISFQRMDERYFAILDIQKRGVIQDDEFRDATRILTEASSAFEHVQDICKYDQSTSFRQNSRKLMQRAAVYAVTINTQYVALFNWDRLVLIRFPELNTSVSRRVRVAKGVGDYCEISVIKDTESKVMCAALLGFLVEAYHNIPQQD